MVTAAVFYLLAYLKRRNQTAHISLACIGFAFDIYATYLMVTVLGQGSISFEGMPPGIKFHGWAALFAIGAFIIQAGLGIQTWRHRGSPLYNTYKKRHGKFAWMFTLVWTVSFLSGFALPFLV